MMAQYQKITEKKCLQQLRESGRLMDLIDDIRANRTLNHILQLNTKEAEPESKEAE